MHDDDSQAYPQGPNDDDLRREAGLEFIKRLDAHFPPPSPWVLLNFIALDPDNLAAVCADIGFVQRVSRYTRTNPPDWLPNPDWEVFGLKHRNGTVIFLDTGFGFWRTERGVPRGDNIITLGQHFWRCSFGRAGHRIKRVCGLRELPHAK